jgi:hypothetical protein
MAAVTDSNYEEVRKKIYKYKSTDPVFLEAQVIIKYQSRRIGSLQGWNTRYRQKIELLDQAAAETEMLRQQLQQTREVLVTALRTKAELESEYDIALTELEKIDHRLGNLKRSYELVSLGNSSTTTLKQRWMLLLQAIKDLLFPPDDEPGASSLALSKPSPPDNDDDRFTETTATIQRDLLENK